MPRKPVRAKPAAKKAVPKKPRSKAKADGDETPVDYMLGVMRDPEAEPKRRDAMAKSATPYIHAKPAAKKRATGSDASLKRRLELARETLKGRLAQLRSDCD